MTYEEIKELCNRELADSKTMRKKPTDYEHQLQASCVRWFNCQYPFHILFAIPNGGQRNAIVAAKLKAEGVLAGVADLFLAYPREDAHGLFIEMKTERRGSRQSDAQKTFETLITSQGYDYVIIKSFDEFKNFINSYLKKQ